MTCSVPQGSTLRPTLWNIFYDGLLKVSLPPSASIVGFADDVSLIVVNHTTRGHREGGKRNTCYNRGLAERQQTGSCAWQN